MADMMSWLDLDTAFTSWVGDIIEEQPDYSVETMPAIKSIFRTVGLLSKRARLGESPTDAQWTEVKRFLWFVSQIQVYKPEMSFINIKGILSMFEKPSNNFGTPIPEVARELAKEFERQGWGKSVNEGPRAATTTTPWIKAPSSHPIYGSNGCMHDILRHQGRYKISPEYTVGNADIFGHNKFAIGSCWARQIAAVRDGVHGHYFAGIYGSEDGVYSIVIAGRYADLDRDEGDRVFYSASGAHETISKTLDMKNHSTKALIRSVQTGKPIRVLRSSGGTWAGCPKDGLRYDGLYRAVKYTTKENKKGGNFLQFQLNRLNNQAAISRNRPNDMERSTFKKVIDGY